MSDVLQALDAWQARRPDAIAFSDAAQALSFRDLARRVAGAAALLRQLPDTLGLLGPSSLDWLVIDLAAWATGKTLIPLPHFFSDGQLRHSIADAGIALILTSPDQLARAAALGAAGQVLPPAEDDWRPATMGGRRIVYTSGSTGTPKGVILPAGQIRQSCAALQAAVAADAGDCHLSVLPFSLLLEAICGIYLPILAGGRCVLAPQVVAAQGAEIATRLGEAAELLRPTTCVLVPQLLQAWCLAAGIGRVTVPDSLRFVAVGGAAVPEALAARAWQLGIPVHEGYGLTECGSVVAVNTPGQRRAGTVGRPLPGYDLRIAADGEIVVASAAVAAGYLNRADGPAGGVWRTGDIGALDADGYLRVAGRKDNLIVTGNGRNIAPEWIETMLLADPRIARCVLLPVADGRLGLLLEPSLLGAGWFRKAGAAQIADLVAALTAAAPAYARPQNHLVLAPEALADAGLLTANGRPRRPAIARHYAGAFTSPDPTMESMHAIL